MSNLSEPSPSATKKNPLIWIALLVVGIIIFIFIWSDRGVQESAQNINTENSVGEIDRSLLIPPGMQARQLIEQIKSEGENLALASLFEKGERFQHEGSLADAHLIYFFGAREGHLPSMMKMAEMADPTLFAAEESLLDQADPVQAYKWYRKASEQGDKLAGERLEVLKQWALKESESGNPYARQLLLSIN